MKEVSGDDELASFGLFYQLSDTSEVGHVIAFWNRETVSLEGGGFTKVNISENERGVIRKQDGVLAEEFNFVA